MDDRSNPYGWTTHPSIHMDGRSIHASLRMDDPSIKGAVRRTSPAVLETMDTIFTDHGRQDAWQEKNAVSHRVGGSVGHLD